MKTNIFVPKKIKVGFQNRKDTYTKKLAYVIYYDQKEKLRKETSWQNWRDDKIPALDFDNTSTEGFVLNKKVGDYVCDWNHRQAYVRVYDPRDFEFEITIENLLFILENANSIKGKGLEGLFVYGWDRDKLILIPTSSPDYIEISKFSKIVHHNNFIKAKDLILGAVYRTKDNDEYIYLGRFDYWVNDSKWQEGFGYIYTPVKKGRYYYFIQNGEGFHSYYLLQLKELGEKFIEVISTECIENYAEMIDELEGLPRYSPIDKSKDEYIPYTFEQFQKWLGKENRLFECYGYNKIIYEIVKNRHSQDQYRFCAKGERNYYAYRHYNHEVEVSAKEMFDKLKPMYKNEYLANGRLFNRGYVENE